MLFSWLFARTWWMFQMTLKVDRSSIVSYLFQLFITLFHCLSNPLHPLLMEWLRIPILFTSMMIGSWLSIQLWLMQIAVSTFAIHVIPSHSCSVRFRVSVSFDNLKHFKSNVRPFDIYFQFNKTGFSDFRFDTPLTEFSLSLSLSF